MSTVTLRPPSAVVIRDHGELTGLGDDDHTQYALLAGRAAGQTLVGGTAASENLILDSTANATKGVVRSLSPLENTYSLSSGNFDSYNWSPTYTSTGFLNFHIGVELSPTVTIDNVGQIQSAVAGRGNYIQSVAPNLSFSTWALFWATPRLASDSTAYSFPGSSTMLSNVVFHANGLGASAGTAGGHRGLDFRPNLVAENANDATRVESLTAVYCQPNWNQTAAGTVSDFNIVRGVHCLAPSAQLLGQSLGTREITDYIGLEFDGMGSITPSGEYAVVRSALTAGTDRYFMRNTGGAASDDTGIYAWTGGGYPRIPQDNVGLRLGASDDVEIMWEGSTNRLRFDPIGTGRAPLDIFWSAFNFIALEPIGATAVGCRWEWDRYSFSLNNAPDPDTVLYWMDMTPGARTIPAASSTWADLIMDFDANAIAVGANTLTSLDGVIIQAPNVNIGTGSIDDESTLRVEGMGTDGTRQHGLWVEQGRSRLDGFLNLGEVTRAQITANSNDLALPSGANGRAVILFSTDASRNVTGFALEQEADFFVGINTGSFDMVLVHEDAGSAAANRFDMEGGANLTIGPDEWFLAYHSAAANRWLVRRLA